MKNNLEIIIETKDLVRAYHDGDQELYALNGVSIQIGKGEFTAIVGPSGSGKTTLLNAIGGLDHPTAGKIIIDKHEIQDLPDNKMIDFRLHNIGFVFQAYNLIPVLSAYENAEFIMLLQNSPEKERKQRVYQLLEKVGLKGRENRRPGELSGGQQQRVAVVRALASKPRFVLADEPTANLDGAATGALLDIMAQLNEEEGITFIFATHDQRVIDRAKRVINLDDGSVKSDVWK